jgi:dTDP-glucose 4,6-dehydratase
MKTCLVTGAAGFIGSNFCRMILKQNAALKDTADIRIIAVDKASEEQFLLNLHPDDLKITDVDKKGFRDYPNDRIVCYPNTPIGDFNIGEIFREHKPDWVVNFAAESHVDRSIDGPEEFWRNNVMELDWFLQACITFGELKKFVHISTDEIYGDRDGTTWAVESDPSRPSSPYAASKVAQEAMVMAYGRTYDMPWVITRCSNNYGPRQAPEKMIPLMISKIIKGKPLPVYGDGKQKRDWLHVDDHCAALLFLLKCTTSHKGSVYNIGRGEVRENIYVVQRICETLRYYRDKPKIEHVDDRPGHDRLYAIGTNKIQMRGWRPKIPFVSGLSRTIDWYMENPEWIEKMIELGYSTDRIGTGT